MNTAQTTADKMEDFKKHVLELNPPRIYSSTPMPDVKHMGLCLLTKVIPKMETDGDVAFAWHYAGNDICVYNQKEYDTETTMYKKQHKMKMDAGDTTWFYDYEIKGKKKRCIMTTEIWYKPRGNHSVSPVAMLFRQFMANGLHITKCRFEDL